MASTLASSGDDDYEYAYESGDDYSYNEGEGASDMSEDEDNVLQGSGEAEGQEFRILTLDSIDKRMQQVIEGLMEITCLSEDDARNLLRHYKWNAQRAQTEWFNSESTVRSAVGMQKGDILGKRARLHSNPQTSPPGDASVTTEYCAICMDDSEDTIALGCSHKFCKVCMRDYVSHAVADGPACTTVSCPEAKCNFRLTSSIIKSASPKSFDRWKHFMMMSFIDQNRSAKWCPSKNCENAVEYPGGGAIDVTCSCGFTFCFGCQRETHRPASCADVVRWEKKNSNESENLTWIMANTKPCPKCHVNIEKNQGCNHMKCRVDTGGCGHDFCWLCLGDWSKHGQETGGYYACNKYEKEKLANKSLKKMEKKKLAARHELERYMHYFERYDNHSKSRKFIKNTLRGIQSKRDTLHDLKGYRIGETQFLLQAAEQIHEARRILQWTYVYGYYLEAGEGSGSRDLFEHLQENLEKFTEQLHELVEIDLSKFADPYKDSSKEFMEHRGRVTNLMASTATYQANLLTGLDEGLQHVGRKK